MSIKKENNMSVLIQRGYFRKDVSGENITGFDSIIELNEMFYAEYEFGALPKSLKAITKDFANMEFFDIEFKKSKKHPIARTITVLANTNKDISYYVRHMDDKETKPSNMKDLIIDEIKGIANYKVRTKGASMFPAYLELEQKDYPATTFHPYDFWWSIDKDYMFFVDDKYGTNATKLIIAFRKLKEKWKEELFPEEVKSSLFGKVKRMFF